MGLESVSHLKLDFVKSKYTAVNAKQFDHSARKIVISCYDNGQFVKANSAYNYAYLRIRRPDGKCIFSACEITKDGKIQFSFKKPMLDVAGKNWADVVLLVTEKPNINKTIGLFAVGNETTDEDRLYYPLPIIDSDNYGHVVVTTVSDHGDISELNVDPSPFVTDDGNGNVVLASILDSGEIVIEEAGIISTMPFCVNVIKSAYFEENTGFIV